jgi:hypothetical protein
MGWPVSHRLVSEYDLYSQSVSQYSTPSSLKLTRRWPPAACVQVLCEDQRVTVGGAGPQRLFAPHPPTPHPLRALTPHVPRVPLVPRSSLAAAKLLELHTKVWLQIGPTDGALFTPSQ